MRVLIWIGALLTLAGLGLLVWLIGNVMKLRKSGLDEAAMRARLEKLGPMNFGALALSFLGLIMVVMGIALS